MILEIIITSVITSVVTAVVTSASLSIARPSNKSKRRYCDHEYTKEGSDFACKRIANARCRSQMCSVHCKELLCGCLEMTPEHEKIAEEVRQALGPSTNA